jgi:SAM-dependent methyltransferase
MESKLYDELYCVEQTHWWFQARRHIVWNLVHRYAQMPRNGRLKVCELGCGTAGNLAAVADWHDVIGVECSPQAIEYAKSRLGSRIIRGSLPSDVPLPPDSFDVVLLTDVLEHIEDDAASARTALHLLHPGGIVVATVPAYQWLYSPRDAHHHHYRRYSKSHFRSLWRDDAQVALLSHYNTLLFPPAAVARIVSKLLGNGAAPGDLTVPPTHVNRILSSVMRCEVNLLGRLPMPIGLSLIAVVRKSGATVSERKVAA